MATVPLSRSTKSIMLLNSLVSNDNHSFSVPPAISLITTQRLVSYETLVLLALLT